MLGWYNTLTALGYHPFLDRLSLDSVENIPDPNPDPDPDPDHGPEP